MLGARRDPYLKPGDWQFTSNVRWQDASRHFNGTEEQVQRRANNNYVINQQRIMDLGGTFAPSRQWNVSVSIPILAHGSWAIPRPTNPPGTRYTQDSSGLGDIILMGRRWALNTDKHPTGNFSWGLGVKLPTGKTNVYDEFPDGRGENIRSRPVDWSIQPGDGGLGAVLDLGGFKLLGNTMLFATGTYLVNPRGHNGTLSSGGDAGTLTPETEYTRYLSVADQYLARIGLTTPLTALRGVNFSLAFRIEGVPAKDMIGSSIGRRRPGFAKFVEPGFSYASGHSSWSLNVPIAYHRNRVADYTGREGDATMADYIVLFSFSHRYAK